jgi:hypothetical protein
MHEMVGMSIKPTLYTEHFPQDMEDIHELDDEEDEDEYDDDESS